MFSFELPQGAILSVDSPTGGKILLVHRGGGHFVSDLPPLVMVGVSTVAAEKVEGLRIGWNGDAFPVGTPQFQCFYQFDAVSATTAVEAAAAAGDVAARGIIERLAEADKVLKARESIGMVKPSGVMQ